MGRKNELGTDSPPPRVHLTPKNYITCSTRRVPQEREKAIKITSAKRHIRQFAHCKMKEKLESYLHFS